MYIYRYVNISLVTVAFGATATGAWIRPSLKRPGRFKIPQEHWLGDRLKIRIQHLKASRFMVPVLCKICHT